jgi:hypothetical protein
MLTLGYGSADVPLLQQNRKNTKRKANATYSMMIRENRPSFKMELINIQRITIIKSYCFMMGILQLEPQNHEKYGFS